MSDDLDRGRMDAFEKERMKWIESLHVGDTVCDCRFKHAKIKTLIFEYCPNSFMRRMIEFVFDRVNINLGCAIDRFLRARKLFLLSELCDADLTMEDGHGCSAYHCCDRADHEWEHPSEEEINAAWGR